MLKCHRGQAEGREQAFNQTIIPGVSHGDVFGSFPEPERSHFMHKESTLALWRGRLAERGR